MHKLRLALLIFLSAALAAAQTTIDLGRQAKNIDFSNSSSTKSFKTGTLLPSTCNQGETYLKLDAPAGQNIYVCTSANVWISQGADAVSAPSFDWSRTGSSQAQLSQGSFRFGNLVTNLAISGSLTLTGTPTGTIWIYATQTGSIVAAHNLGAGNLSLTGTGYTVDALGGGFPFGSLPLHQCAVTSGALPVSCADLRTNLSASAVSAGTSGGIGVDCSSGSNCIVDIVPAAVPLKTAANTFTALNSFSHMKLPSGASPDPLQCSSTGDAGKVWISTAAATGRQVQVCEGVAGWRVQGDPLNISTPANLGYVSSVPLGSVLAAQTTVASANQVRLALIPVTNQVRLARLAAFVANASSGGKARVGLYRADGTLLAQSGDLDTGSITVRSSAIAPVVLDPGFYYFAWSVDDTDAKLAGAGNTAMTGLFNHVSASPGQASCLQPLTASGLPATCTLVPAPDTDGFPVIAIVGFAQ